LVYATTSGIAVVTVAQQIAAGEVDAGIAGGMENMDRAPYLMDGGRWGYRMGPAEIHDSMLRDGLDDAFSGKHSGCPKTSFNLRVALGGNALHHVP